MERHKSISLDKEKHAPTYQETPSEYFVKAKEFAFTYYSDEIERALSIKWEEVGPNLFFKEYVWVVHATGFSAKAVTKFIEKLLISYGDWYKLSTESDQWQNRVLSVCNNPQKARAVYQTAKILKSGISEFGWEAWKEKNIKNVDQLQKLPYIGPITKYHLGRNIGLLDCVKPDLHLERLSSHFGFNSSNEMIKHMSISETMPLGIIDMIVWYYASTFGTSIIRSEGQR